MLADRDARSTIIAANDVLRRVLARRAAAAGSDRLPAPRSVRLLARGVRIGFVVHG